MADKKANIDFNKAFQAIDPKTLFPFFNGDLFGEWFKSQGFANLDAETILKVQQSRLQALARANEHATGVYRAHLERQAKLFDDVVRDTWASLEKTDMSGSSEATNRNLDLYKAATEKAVALMQQYSEATQAAAQAAYQKLAADLGSTIKDIRKT